MPTSDVGSYTEQQGLLHDEEKYHDLPPLDHKTPTRNRAYIALLWCIIVLQAFGIAAILFTKQKCQGINSGIRLYSPAENAVEYQIKSFNFGIGDDLSPFQQPPSPELDLMWQQLYGFGITRIPKNQAEKLANKTVPIPGDPDGYYITSLDVIHQLHCLNTVRKALYPDYYPRDEDWDIHTGHCIDSIRQSLMCSADVSTISWQWDERRNKSKFAFDVAHTCRNFEKLQGWAKENVILGKFDDEIRMDDDIRVPLYREDGSTYWP